jgi:Flp pilus assembly pilin Flp
MLARLRSLLSAEGGFSAIEYGLIAAFGLIAMGELISKL